MARVVFEHVDKVFSGNVRAVDDLSLDIRDGECLAIVGPSGCGKSTALRMIAGLEDVSSGSISIDGRVVNDMPPHERDVAMVFQNYALYPHMTVAQNLAFALEMQRVPKSERRTRVASVAQTLGLTELLERRPAQLSGGQRQRVAMGRAIIRHPAIYLMDEPLSNLDARLRAELRAELKRLHQALRVTTVYVTHDQVEAMTLGDRIAVMRDGRLQQIGTPAELFETPVNAFVAEFIGTPAMNFAPARLERNGSTQIVMGERSLALPAVVSDRLRELTATSARDIVVGIRPTDFQLANDTTPEAFVFDIVPEVVESLGSAQDVLFPLAPGATDFTARLWTATLPARTNARRGVPLRLSVDPQRVHFFDSESRAIRD